MDIDQIHLKPAPSCSQPDHSVLTKYTIKRCSSSAQCILISIKACIAWSHVLSSYGRAGFAMFWPGSLCTCGTGTSDQPGVWLPRGSSGCWSPLPWRRRWCKRGGGHQLRRTLLTSGASLDRGSLHRNQCQIFHTSSHINTNTRGIFRASDWMVYFDKVRTWFWCDNSQHRCVKNHIRGFVCFHVIAQSLWASSNMRTLVTRELQAIDMMRFNVIAKVCALSWTVDLATLNTLPDWHIELVHCFSHQWPH